MSLIEHKDLTSIHPFAFVSDTEPDAELLAANKGWIDTSVNPPHFKLRNEDNDGWITLIQGGIKVYRALLTQSGTDDPSSLVLENTLGVDIVWERTSAGTYVATASGVFTVNKTWLRCSGAVAEDGTSPWIAGFYQINANSVLLASCDFNEQVIDNVLLSTPIEILVYP